MVALITDAHYRMSPALIRSLAKAGVRVYTSEKENFSSLPGARSKYGYDHFTLPEEGYEDALYELLERLGKEHHCKPALLPVGAATLRLISKNAERFSTVAGICVADSDTLALLNSKQQLHQLAATLEIPLPRNFEGDFDTFSYPCVVKPVCGEKYGLPAEARYRICHTPQEARAAYEHFQSCTEEPPLVQEYLPGGGIGCSVIAEKGVILAHIGHRRIREYPISGGPSSCCIAEEHPLLLQWAEKLVAATHFSGLAMFEFKEDASGNPRLLECNPRIWGSFPLTHTAQSTLPYCWFAAAWNQGNPTQAIPLPTNQFLAGKKMTFFPSDLMAGLGYLKKKEPRRALSALIDLLNPRVRDGVFQWSDPAPAFAYYAGFFRRGGKL